MPKVKISEFSSTPGNNTDIDGINIAENCPPSGINDAIRELMAQLKDFQQGTAGDSFNGPVGTTTAAAGAFTTLSASGAVTLSGGTANGVPYLNGSKVLTTGSALTFDGAKLVNTSGVAGALIQSTDTGGSGSFLRMLGDASSGNLINWTTGTALRFATSADNFGSFAEQMRLTSTGLGIGTSSPAYKLDVRGANRILNVAAITGTNGAYETFSNSAGTFFVGLDSSTASEFGGVAYSANLYHSGNYPMLFWTNGLRQMTLDSSGNLGLGVTPSAAVSNNKFIGINGATAWSGYNAGGVYAYSLWGNAAAGLSLNGGKASEFTWDSSSGAFAWRLAGSSTAGNAISFNQAMSLTSAGTLLVGRTSPSDTTVGFEVTSGGRVNCGMASGDAYILFSTSAGAYRFYVTNAGVINATSTTITAISDQRLKENIRDLDDGLDVVMALKPRKFDWKAGKGQDIKNARGFIAQEFEQVLPDMIEEWKDPAPEGEEPYKAINANLIPTLVKAIQELKAEFDAYKAAHP